MERALDYNVDIVDTTKEIALLNERYSQALQNKVAVYDQLVSTVRQLAERNALFMRNEVELCRLNNMSRITKLELEQKQRQIQEQLNESADPLMVSQTIQEKDALI